MVRGMTRRGFGDSALRGPLRLPSPYLQLRDFRVSSLHSPSRPPPNTNKMPPRKKAKASAASTPLRDTQPRTPQDSGVVQSQDELLSDPWADEQETQLLKSMMKWKPTGTHTQLYCSIYY
jgi:hypothetical protein